jgi:hypothetical protein
MTSQTQTPRQSACRALSARQLTAQKSKLLVPHVKLDLQIQTKMV